MILSLVARMLVIMTGISMTNAAGCPSDARARCPSDAKKPWSFDPELSNGPPYWSDDYPDCSPNGLQSPIDIPTTMLGSSPKTNGLIVNGYDKPLSKAIVKNTGYTVTVTPSDGIDRTVTVNDVDYSLQLITLRVGNQTEFRGRETVTPGSDHRIDGKQDDAELQFIHSTNKSDDGMVIISRLLGASFTENFFLSDLISDKAVKKISYQGDTYVQNGTEAQLDIFVTPGSPYYSYEGSLSTPPCTPGVTWLIVKNRSFIGVNQVISLSQLYSVQKDDPNVDTCRLVNSFRPPQDIADREITS